jgi:hypothetical protein
VENFGKDFVCHVLRSRGKFLDSFYNRIYHSSWTQYLVGPATRYFLASPGQLDHCMYCIHQIRSTVLQQLGRDRNHAGCLVVFQVFQCPSFSLRLGKSMSTPSSLESTGCVSCSNSELSFKCSTKCSFHLASTWFMSVNSSPYLARHIATCGSNGRLTSFRRL